MIESQTSVVRRGQSADLHSALLGDSVPIQINPVRWTRRRHLACFWQSLRFGIPLLVTDLAVVTSILFVVIGGSALVGFESIGATLWILGVMQAISVVSFLTCMRLYRNVGMHPVEELQRVVTATALAFGTLLMIFLWRNDGDVRLELTLLLISGGLAVVVLPSVRHLVRCRLGKTKWWRYPAIIISPSNRNEKLVQEMNREGHLGWRPIGYVDNFQSQWNRENPSEYCLGNEEELSEIIERENVFWGITETHSTQQSVLQKLLDRFHPDLPNIVSVSSDNSQASLFSYGIDCGSNSGFCYRSHLTLLVPQTIKRSVDIFVSAVAILFLSPLLVLLMVAVRLSSRGPIFYSQERVGLNGNPFRIWKFRSMVQDADRVLKTFLANDVNLRAEWKQTQKLVNDPRITLIGRFLRRSSLDELPQLWNVLNGSMSLVGPRPIIRSEIEKYGKSIWLYYRTTPGITGLWQVNGRNLTTYEERLAFDSFYVRNWSIWLDWYILLKTVRVVVLCEGAY